MTMGGMFTIQVRDELRSYDDPGWDQNPPGTPAKLAAAEDLRADGIALRRG
jgi:manganese oxidase